MSVPPRGGPPGWLAGRLDELAREMGHLSGRCAWARKDPTRTQELARREWARLLGEALLLGEKAGLVTRGGERE